MIQTQLTLGILGIIAVILFLILQISIASHVRSITNMMKEIGTTLGTHTRILRRIAEGESPNSKKELKTSLNFVPVNKNDFCICRCGAFKAYTEYCPVCNSGISGKKIKDKIWDQVKEIADGNNKTDRSVIDEMAVCKKCEALKKQNSTCPVCGPKTV